MKYTAPTSIIVSLFVLALSGCGSTEPDGSSTSEPGSLAADEGSHDQTEMEEMKEGLAKLSPEDAASAEKQRTCPVSGELLGTMGAPQKVDVKGQQVWICCGGCKEQLLEKADEYLAELNKE